MSRRMYYFVIIFIFMHAIFTSLSTLHATEPSTEPILRIETAMHILPIGKIAIDLESRYLVTVSSDKTLRVWAISTGELIRVIRPPIGSGREGILYSVAISPDGTTIACSGWTGYTWDKSAAIYIFSLSSGLLKKRITKFPQAVIDLTYSPNGKYLAATMSNDNGIQIYRTDSYEKVAEDWDYGEASLEAAFDNDGRLITVCNDGYIRLYNNKFKLLERKRSPGGNKPLSVSFSPDGLKVAIGYDDSTRVDVLSGQDLSLLYFRDTKGTSKRSGVARFSLDGNYLYAGHDRIHKWLDGGQGRSVELEVGIDTILTSILPMKHGGIAFSAGDPAFGIIGSDDKLRYVKSSFVPNFRSLFPNFLVSFEGDTFKFAYDYEQKSTALFFLKERDLWFNVDLPRSAMKAPITKKSGLSITDWHINRVPKINGKPLQIYKIQPHENERSFSLAISPNGESFLLGTEGHLYLFDINGREKWRVIVPNFAFAVNISGNGRLAIAALGDGTIRWYQMEDGKEKLAFFPHKDKNQWVLWTPEGYFDASPKGAELIGYHINQGKDREAKFISMSNLYDVFYRPDILQAKIRDEDISGLITLTAKEALATPPPTVKFTKTPPASSVSQMAKVCYQVRSTGGGIGEVRLFQNGKLIKSDGFYRELAKNNSPKKIEIATLNSRAIYQDQRSIVIRGEKASGSTTSISKREVFNECVDIETTNGENEISLAAFNAPNTVQGMMETVVFNSTRKSEEPHLYILAVGIDNYSDPSINLKYAAKDAIDFISKFPPKATTIYKPQNIHIVTLTNKKSNKQEILKVVDELSQKVKHSDSFIFFNASHGLLLQNQYYIVTANFNGDTNNSDSLISSNEIVEMSKKIKSLSQLFIFDTCHAGGLDNIISGLYDARMVNLARKMGLHIYASAGSIQSAIDGFHGNGLYTYTLLQGIENGKEVDNEGDGKVTIKKLGLYSKQKTIEISTKLGHTQTPYIINFGRDNTLFLVK